LGNRVSRTNSGFVINLLQDMQPGLAQNVAIGFPSLGTTTRLVHTPFGLLAQRDNAGNWEWMLEDGLGSVRSVVNNSGSVVEHRHFEPYGSLYAGAMAETPFGFTGEWRDGGTGMYYLRARYYNPSMGAFVSQDALETPNRYAYVGGNVVNRVDLNGLQAWCSIGGVLVVCPDPIVVTIPPITWIPPGVTPTIPTPTPTPYPITPQPTQPPTIGTPIPTAPTAGVTPTPTAPPAPTLTPAPTAAPTATPAPVPSASVPAPYVTPLPSDYAVCVVSSPTPTATTQRCDPQIFANWWYSLRPVPQSLQPNRPSYRYEQRVCRDSHDALSGTMTRTVARGLPFQVDADGANPHHCRLLECKFSDPDADQPQIRPDAPPWVVVNTLDEFSRYRLAILNGVGSPGARISALELRTNSQALIPVLEQWLTNVGFAINIDAFVRFFP
jgi:RHS repeat-associated protein